MNDILSFETAKTLKEIGFPEPKFETGQLWYNEFGVLTFIGHREGKEFYCHSLRNGRTEKMYVEHGEGTYFCPTATDILREMGQCVLLHEKTGWIVCFLNMEHRLIAITAGSYSSPHEAAAQAYINWKRNETPPTP